MDEKQKSAFNASVFGHNTVITGQAGSGKTFVAQQVFDYLKNERKTYVTCSTGIACQRYRLTNAITLHKFAGLEDGRHTNQRLAYLLLNDERFCEARERLLDIETLIIDEISMISKKTFLQLDHICQIVRKSTLHFGGIQLILIGDFFFNYPP